MGKRKRKTRIAKPKPRDRSGRARARAQSVPGIREQLAMRQVDLAELIGVHPLTVSKWERGILQPRAYQRDLLDTLAGARIPPEQAIAFQLECRDLSRSTRIPQRIAVLYRMLQRAIEPEQGLELDG